MKPRIMEAAIVAVLLGGLFFWLNTVTAQRDRDRRQSEKSKHDALIMDAYGRGFSDALNSCLKHLPLVTNAPIEIAPIIADMNPYPTNQ